MLVPLEHALLTKETGDRDRTAVFARYSLIGSLTAALGDAPGQLMRREIQQSLHVEGADLRIAQDFRECHGVRSGCPQAVQT